METRRYQTIRKVLVALPFYFLTFLPLSAQTFTQRVQQPVNGQGTVTIHESDDIDRLVNSAVLGSTAAAKSSQSANSTTSGATASGSSSSGSSNPATTTADQPETEMEMAPVDHTKKIIRNGYKVSGYRVQAFAGGNSRKDRQQAEQIGNSIKASFPNEPVYVHFYSPRWSCRVGNYRTYEEAHEMLLSLRQLGYTQATIVKGKITVQ